MTRKLIRWLFEPFFPRGRSKTSDSRSVAYRALGNRAAVILVHGFTGSASLTWSAFSEHLLNDQEVATWDVYSLGFPSNLRVDVVDFWDADPDLTTIARQLSTTLSLDPFRNYGALAIVAHSMGGLVIQRALLDDKALSSRVSHVFLFGTPSLGLPKARVFSKIKRQLRDISPSGDFIKTLRAHWNERFAKLPFILRVIGGERDEFVPSSTSLKPFPDEVRAVVPGNHIEIVRPTQPGDQSVRIVVEALAGRGRNLPTIDGARLAVELGQFREAVNVLLPQSDKLDDNAAISLSLALESLGSAQEALQFLQSHYDGRKTSTDVMGTLAGRLKRRWLASRNEIDHERALGLYEAGFSQAEKDGDHDQAFYHAINISFLKLMRIPPYSAITNDVKDMAQRAKTHCELCEVSVWRLATEGEALLILGDLDGGLAKYVSAIAKATSQREIDSMYAQALRIAERIYAARGLKRIQEAFKFSQSPDTTGI